MSEDLIDDGLGTAASAVCPTCGKRAMYFNRPGDARCAFCEAGEFVRKRGEQRGVNFTGTCPVCYKKFSDCECGYLVGGWFGDKMPQQPVYPTKPILYVRWIDAMNHQDRLFVSVMKAKELTTAETIGYLIHEDDEKIILAQNIYHIPETPEPSAENCMEIPKGTIQERREL